MQFWLNGFKSGHLISHSNIGRTDAPCYFAVHCGNFEGVNVSVYWKDFANETAFKIPDSLISALTTEKGS